MTVDPTPIDTNEPEMTLEEAKRILDAFVAALQEIDAQRQQELEAGNATHDS